MGAIVLGLRPGDHKRLNQVADQWGRPPKEVAGILLEEAIRREANERRGSGPKLDRVEGTS
jgi:hypothetical protein